MRERGSSAPSGAATRGRGAHHRSVAGACARRQVDRVARGGGDVVAAAAQAVWWRGEAALRQYGRRDSGLGWGGKRRAVSNSGRWLAVHAQSRRPPPRRGRRVVARHNRVPHGASGGGLHSDGDGQCGGCWSRGAPVDDDGGATLHQQLVQAQRVGLHPHARKRFGDHGSASTVHHPARWGNPGFNAVHPLKAVAHVS